MPRRTARIHRGLEGGYYFFRRDFFAATRLRAAAALSIAKSSILRPCLSRAASHRGRAPRPAQVSPPGPRYFGGTLRPFIAERRPPPPRELVPPSAPSRESCFSSSLRFSTSLLSISPRSVSSASTSIPLRFIAGINGLPSNQVELRLIELLNRNASTLKWYKVERIPNQHSQHASAKTCNVSTKVERQHVSIGDRSSTWQRLRFRFAGRHATMRLLRARAKCPAAISG